MTLLLLFATPGSGPADGAVSFPTSATVSFSADVEAVAAVGFAGSANLAASGKATLYARVAFTAGASLAPTATKRIEFSKVEFRARAALNVLVRPRGKRRRTVVVDAFGEAYGELEAARHGAITWELNKWEEASFAGLLSDPKSRLVLEERIREVQLWRGDQMLVFGPMVRPAADKTALAVTVKGPLWHLSRRHVGKAGRDNRLVNGDFEAGLAGWHFLKTKHFLDYAPIDSGQVDVFEPGKRGRALALRMDLAPWYTPPSSIGSGSFVHEVVVDDTLWDLARTFYGSGTQWRTIFDANAALIEADARAAGLWNPRDPGHWIFPGQDLTIPRVSASAVVEAPPDGNTLWGEVFGFQEFDVFGGTRGIEATLTGWAYVRSSEFEGYGLDNRGLFLSRMPANYRFSNYFTGAGLPNTWGGRRALNTDVKEHSASTIDEEHPFDRWVRHEVTIRVPPMSTEILHARVCGVQGFTGWDEVALTYDDAFEALDVDQSTIVEELLEHAQDPAFDKSDANIAAEAPPTGIVKSLVALHSEHANLWNLIEGFTEAEDGFDVSAAISPTSRKLVVHYPAKGSHRPGLALELGRNVADFAWTFDGEAGASSVIVLGTGDGSDREEASAIDPDAFAGGLTLEEVFSAPPDTPIELLESIATERLKQTTAPEVLALKTYPHSDVIASRNLIGRLVVGDTTDVRIRRGGLELEDVYRVVRLTLNPDDTLDLVVNRRSLPT